MPDPCQEDIPQARFWPQSSDVSVGGTGCGDTPGQCDGDVLQGMLGLATWACPSPQLPRLGVDAGKPSAGPSGHSNPRSGPVCPHSIPKSLHRVPSTPATYSVAQICAYHWTKRTPGEMELDTKIKPSPSRLRCFSFSLATLFHSYFVTLSCVRPQ